MAHDPDLSFFLKYGSDKAFGKEKQAAIKNLIDSDIIDESIPCTVLKKHPSVYVLVDKEADFRN